MEILALKDFTPHAVLTPIATFARWDKKKPQRPGALSWRRRREGWGGNRPLPTKSERPAGLPASPLHLLRFRVSCCRPG